jgi:hypothetical protein
MFARRSRETDPYPVENVAARLGRALATPGPHDERIGHHRTYEGNVDPARRGLAVVGRRPAETGARGPLAAVLGRIVPLGRRSSRSTPETALRAAKQAGSARRG